MWRDYKGRIKENITIYVALQTRPHLTTSACKSLFLLHEANPAEGRGVEDGLGFEVHQCILVHDDLDLPLGAVRARNRGSDGGHRGLRSILQAFQDDRFRRVKIGVGHAPEGQSVIDFVLTPFGEEQRAIVTTINRAAADKVIELLRQRVTV